MVSCLIAAMNLIDAIRGCTLIGEIEMLEWLFELSESEKQGGLYTKTGDTCERTPPRVS